MLKYAKLIAKIRLGKNSTQPCASPSILQVDMMIAWESRKRSTNPGRVSPLNVALPFSFIDLHRKLRGFSVETALRNYADSNIKWSPQVRIKFHKSHAQLIFQFLHAVFCD